jgi:chitinase
MKFLYDIILMRQLLCCFMPVYNIIAKEYNNMRYLATANLKEGMVLGKSLIGIDGGLLLRQGQIIHNSYIKKIKGLGFNGIYISDEISHDIYIDDVVSEEVRIEAVNAVKNIFSNQDKLDTRELEKNIDDTKNLF